MLLDYETLRLTWWFLVIILWLGFVLTDGFDMGVGAILKLVAKTDEETRVAINVLAPHWDGNQVWFVLAAGAIFAAWPMVYATGFSVLYPGMMIALFTLFLRPVAFDYRSKLESPRWRNSWDISLITAGVVPPFIFGLAVGNLLLGLPFEYNDYLRASFQGSIFGLFHPFALISGLLGVVMLAMHGASYLMLRTDQKVYERARGLLAKLPLLVFALFILAGAWLGLFMDGYQISSVLDPAAPSNPTRKTVELISGGWLNNYQRYPLTLLAPLLGILGTLGVFYFSQKHKVLAGFLCSSLSIVGIVCTAAVSLFPFVIPSSLNPSHSLTLWDASSSELTLMVMTIATLIFVPILIAYNIWCYVKMWRTVTLDLVRENNHSLY